MLKEKSKRKLVLEMNIVTKDFLVINSIDKLMIDIEAYKTLRTNLLYTDNLKVIAITSTLEDEGKTVTSFNLAYNFAKMGKKVCLIDGDLRRSSLKNYLLISDNSVGLSEVLTNQVTEYVRATNIENFYIVLSGKRPPNPTDILSTESFKKIIEDLKKSFDYVIIDTPPMTVAMDAAIIGRESDGVVLVIRNEFVKKKAVKRCQIEMERSGCRIIGVVLNRIKKSQMGYSYYYDYGKYY